MMIYREVWREGEYERGDVVTWGGSIFIAQRKPTGKPGDPDSGWRLAVKHGRDGKDGSAPTPPIKELVRLK
jgi:integrin beta 3